MSMTYNDLYDLSCFGEIPAETEISQVKRRFDEKTVYSNGIVAAQGLIDSLPYGTSTTTPNVDASAKLSSVVSADCRCRVLLFVAFNGSGNQTIQCRFADGSNGYSWHSVSTSTNDGGGLAGGIELNWWVTAENFDNNTKFRIVQTTNSSASMPARYILLGFPQRLGHDE